ncbi:MAG: ABC transporter permease [Phycisphaerales bacterium]|nr:ABC transporter permease [Phycisphaerales bacterium]
MKSFFRTFKTAGQALMRNITRSVLTCLGIIIGIAAVIAMMEIGNGVSALNAKAISGLGANTIMIMPGTAASGGITFGAGSLLTLTPQDCDAIAQECPAISAAAPTVSTSAQLIYANRNWVPMQITGTTPAYLDVRAWGLDEGSMFTDQDVRNSAKVCIIGQTIKRQLFGDEDPIGREMRLGHVSIRVVGVLQRKGANMMGRDQDDLLIAPWTTIKYRVSGSTGSASAASSSSSVSDAVNTLNNLYPSTGVQLYPVPSASQQANTPQPVRFTNINTIMASANSTQEIPVAIEQVTQLLRQRHRLRPDQPDDFQVRDMTEFANALGQSTSLISNLLLIVATISLMVGGVGIMNIMLVSVTERTREIGLRMAVGARSRDILRQFIIEAILLCLLGGAVGILLGRGVSLLARWLAHFPTAISIPAIVASVVVAASVGLIFGFYPAWKASRLDPIEALRYE